MTRRKFHRTVIQIEVLSEEPYHPESLEQIAEDIKEGACSGKWIVEKTDVIDGQQCANALAEQGSDPEFFMLTAEGEDSE